MNKKISVLISMLLIFSLTLCSLSGCSKNEIDNSLLKPTEVLPTGTNVDYSGQTSDINNTEDNNANNLNAAEITTIEVEKEDDNHNVTSDEIARLEAEKKEAEEEAARLEAEKKAAEEEAARIEAERKAAEEEAARLEAERIAAEKEKERLQKLSFSMMYYLAITSEKIRTSKDSRLILDDIYDSLLNDINPGVIDKTTQDHLNNLREVIKNYRNISTKRERLQFVYNQSKAAAIRSAVPNPVTILSLANSTNWVQLAINVAYTTISSISNYRSASESADSEFLMSGWDLDDEELATIQRNREAAFNYMVDMVRVYNLDGLKTLNERAISSFVEICAIESPSEKIMRLTAEESTYCLLGDYWIELADCYFNTNQYGKCLECIEKYNELAAGIYRKDYNYAGILPKVIVASQNYYTGDSYITKVSKYNEDLYNNTSTDDWSERYFVAEIYLDLYARTNDNYYLEKAFEIAKSNVTVLLPEQRKLNDIYLNELQEMIVVEPDYRFMTEEEEKKKKAQYKEEKKKAEEYNDAMEDKRECEVPSLYGPLVLNLELLSILMDKVQINEADKRIIQDAIDGIFLTKPVNDEYSFKNVIPNYNIEITKSEIKIPAYLLSDQSMIYLEIKDNDMAYTFKDCVIDKVKREGSTVDTFVASVKSKAWKDYKIQEGTEIQIKIIYTDAYDKELILNYYVSEYEEHWYGDKVVYSKR